ncbi:MAG TPA: potassium-transporting ATPase subunit B, partial [Methylococcales bacterium]
MSSIKQNIFNGQIIQEAAKNAVIKLDPRKMVRNPVMFVTMIGAAITTFEIFISHEPKKFTIQIALWLWFTVLFANFAEAMAEGRGKAQADALRKSRTQLFANRLRKDGSPEQIGAEQLRKDDIVLVIANEVIPGDGEIIEGAATVDESAITGESAPVIRESGGDRSAVTGGTKVLSDQIKIR